METTPSPGSRRRRPRRGFTLIEAASAMIIISLAVVAMCGLLAAGTTANVSGAEQTAAVNLTNNIHELTLGLGSTGSDAQIIGPYRDAWDLNGRSFSPPIDGGGRPIPDYPDWEQQVAVQTVDKKNVGAVVGNDRAAPLARLTVTVFHRGHYVYTQSWLIAAEEP